ncbi:MAG: aspartyl/glutamyl-tRNA amidotransferase subunit [Candidatus Peribacteria bacterium]|nr:aspartyl/glutamyl-tRNA amidotransferase subunit [Candidatus Peribacteria bacterium]
MPDLEVIIGLEVHAQMNTKTKMFCNCDNDAFNKQPNTTVCPVCMGHPGTLPVANEQAVEKAIAASVALGCTISEHNHFDRKHYFYPDLPSGFQISQYDFPLAQHGQVEYDLPTGSDGKTSTSKVCRIHRLHMENDAGKLTHEGNKTLCDYNRAGTPLMEIVTEPDLRNSDEAVAFAEELRRIVVAVNSSEADMFKGMMRFDASISLREKGTEKLNPRSEIKNLNSFKALKNALQYEEKRLRKLWEETNGPMTGDITVGWQDDEGKTRLLRSKETADDYRYFPEPDIPPLHVPAEKVEAVRASLPPLPRALKQKYVDLKLTAAEANMLVDLPKLSALYDAVHAKTGDAKKASGLILTQLMGFLNAHHKTLDDLPGEADILELVDNMENGIISGSAGKQVLEEMLLTGKTAPEIIKEKGLMQVSDDGAIEELVKRAMEANADSVAAYRGGKQAALGAIVGWIMKESKGSANPKKVNEVLVKMLG